MATTTVDVICEFGAASFFGLATKTYYDWKKKRQSLSNEKKVALSRLIGAFFMNSLFAVVLGSHIADMVVTHYPSMADFGKGIAYTSGALAINIMFGFLAVKWEAIITQRLKGR